jgi:hypothetical protein
MNKQQAVEWAKQPGVQKRVVRLAAFGVVGAAGLEVADQAIKGARYLGEKITEWAWSDELPLQAQDQETEAQPERPKRHLRNVA